MENNFDSLIELESSFSNITFIENDHKYTINGNPAKLSVSQLLKKYETPFDSDKISSFVARKDGISQQDVLRNWEFTKDYSCHKGSEFHKIVENHFSRKQIKIDKTLIEAFFNQRMQYKNKDSIEKYYKEMALLIRNFLNFYDWWKQDHILLKSEFVIGDELSGICGTIDNLSYNKKTKQLVIFDYKTNKEIKKQNPRNETLLGCLCHLQNCEYTKYSLQLNLYKMIIENKTSFSIPKSYIVWMSGKDNYELIECLDLKKESQEIVKNFIDL